MADMICLLHEGVVQQIGTPQDLLQRPANEFVINFFASQKLQLKWAVYTLEDVFAQLPTQPLENNRLTIPIETSIRETMNLLHEQPQKMARVAFQQEHRYFDLSSLMKAFQEIN